MGLGEGDGAGQLAYAGCAAIGAVCGAAVSNPRRGKLYTPRAYLYTRRGKLRKRRAVLYTRRAVLFKRRAHLRPRRAHFYNYGAALHTQ